MADESIGWWWTQAWELITDAFRFFHGLIYWNVRKSWFRLLGRHGRNPCQNPGDGDVAGTIRCEACVHWSRPGRFGRVCPLLIRREGEWYCGAPRNKVRSFWGRAIGWYAVMLAAGYLTLTGVAFGTLRATRSMEITWWQIAWPGNWDQIPKGRAQAFFHRAIGAFAVGRPSEALVALGSARGLDARDYDTRLLQAQLAMFQFNTAFADEEFLKLLEEFPDRRGRTGLVYHDTLLALFRHEPLALLCLKMTAADSSRTALWVRSLLHALRMGGGAVDFAAKHDAEIQGLPAHARLLVAAEVAVQSGNKARANEILARPFDGPLNPVYLEEQLTALARLGDVNAARNLLRRIGPVFGDFDFLLGELTLDYFTSDSTDEQLDLRRVLTLSVRANQVHRLLGLLIAQGDRRGFGLVEAYVSQRPELTAEVSGAALWVASVVAEKPDAAAHWRTAGRQQFGDSYPSINAIDFSVHSLDRVDGVPSLINALTLPREIIFALQDRVEKKPAGNAPGR